MRPTEPESKSYCRYEPDIWTEVAKHLQGTDLLSLSATCIWFRRLLDDSIWRHAFLRDISLHTDDPKMLRLLQVPRPLDRSWRLLYATAFDGTHSYCFHQPDECIGSFRIGGFLMDTPKLLLTTKLALPPWLMPMLDDSPDTLIGACLLTNVRPGIWIADMNMVRCLVCDDLGKCQGTMQVLDARHCELYMESKFINGTWEYEELGSHLSDGQADTAAAAIFNRNHVDTPCVKSMLNPKSWIRGRSNLLPRAYHTPVAVALSTNLIPNGGLLSRFEVIRDTTRDGQIVSVRITQQLL
ncbi:probable F-box protein At3g61730 [Hordeum vulgare subsp. vulgare]|uniref:probable F-box protein At3g61730 n=1 Tax=Hordeum vulgare subsp. vulgare TaxID=112509 RepID=UPI001D1A3BE1|nr:probable F-box protein At3g61730 [Hordeum vulgare subsp. vulgare]